MGDNLTPLAEPVGIVRAVTKHAVKRWMERTGNASETRAITSIRRNLARAVEVQLAPKYRATALLNHDLSPARYLRFDTWIFVVSPEGVLLTVHTGAAKRWLAEPTTRRKVRRARKSS